MARDPETGYLVGVLAILVFGWMAALILFTSWPGSLKQPTDRLSAINESDIEAKRQSADKPLSQDYRAQPHFGIRSPDRISPSEWQTLSKHSVEAIVERTATAFRVPSERVEQLAPAIVDASERNGIAPSLMIALVMTESSFRTDVRSSAGAIGPAQIVPRWWQDTLCLDLTLANPQDNIVCGARIIAHYRDRCTGRNSPTLCALEYYNVGPTAIEQGSWQKVAAANRYTSKIVQYLRDFQSSPITERIRAAGLKKHR